MVKKPLMIVMNVLVFSLIFSVSMVIDKPVHATETDEANVCVDLEGMEISADDIDLPTTGATITSASLETVEDQVIEDAEYCEVLGAIHPVDSEAPDINFQVNLPTEWNKKFLQFGGGYFNGTVVTGLGNIAAGDKESRNTPLAQGYVTFGSDSGNATEPLDASFAMNDESLKNFAGDQLKKTKDVALNLANTRYNTDPDQVYYAGGSEGGREGLFIVQNFPDEYDGVISVYPVLNWIPKAIKDNQDTQALYENDGEGWISPDDNKLINETVLEVCDSLDGVEDGVISNMSACAEKEDEILDTLSQSLSEEQIEVVKSFNASMKFDFQLANGFTTMPGYSQLQGADIGVLFGTRPIPDIPPVVSESVGRDIDDQDALMGVYSDQVIRYKITGDSDFNTLTFDPNEYSKEILEVSHLLDVTDPDISEFKENGGKLILLHGTEDQMVAPQGTADYYNQLVDEFGQDLLDQFVQFYMVPGFSHGGGKFTMSADLLGALDTWVVDEEAPTNLVTADQNAETEGRTRPLCEHPTYPRYNGSGDIDSAASYTCVDPKEAGFEDVDKDNAHYEGIMHWYDKGKINGYLHDEWGKKEYRPWEKLSRQHAAVLLSRVLDLETPENVDDVLSQYSDVTDKTMYRDEIAAVTEADIFKGNNEGLFSAEKNITREQMATVLVNAYDLTGTKHKDINLKGVDAAHKDNVQILADLSITSELEDYRPTQKVSRGQFATFLYNSNNAK